MHVCFEKHIPLSPPSQAKGEDKHAVGQAFTPLRNEGRSEANARAARARSARGCGVATTLILECGETP